MQIAAICFVALLIVATFAGCAKYNGNEAAFCAKLATVPSFAKLSAEVNDGTRQQASERMNQAAATFRALERIAPRTIRVEVADLGDSAERIAANIDPETPPTTRMVFVQKSDGTMLEIPLSTSSRDRLSVFFDELANHHGTVEAMYSLATYARTNCGFEAGGLDLGMMGFGPSSETGPPGDPVTPPLVVVPGQNQVPVTPPPGAVPPGLHTAPTTLTGPATTSAPTR